MMQVTPAQVDKAIRSNCYPPGYLWTVVIIAVTKRWLADEISDEWRLTFLNYLEKLTTGPNDPWLTAELIAAVDPMGDAEMEMFYEASKLDRGKPGKPGMFDALVKFFPA